MHSMKDVLNPLISEGFTVISPDKTLLVPSFWSNSNIDILGYRLIFEKNTQK